MVNDISLCRPAEQSIEKYLSIDHAMRDRGLKLSSKFPFGQYLKSCDTEINNIQHQKEFDCYKTWREQKFTRERSVSSFFVNLFSQRPRSATRAKQLEAHQRLVLSRYAWKTLNEH
jgi:hypothetical protein